MAALDRLLELQRQGMDDQDAYKQMREEGFAVREIRDSLAQAKVKNAVSSEEISDESQAQEQAQTTQEQYTPEQVQQEQYPAQEQYTPEQLAQMQQEYPQEGYYQQPAIDTGTIVEIAEQVASEKLSDFEQKTGNLLSFKSQTEDKLNDLNERLKRLENSIDTLQQAIIKRVSEFSETTETVHKDLENLHSTVSKLMNPLVDNYRLLKSKSKE
jgi:hypothetical protein